MGVYTRIARNTILLSVRLVLQIIIQLYTVPVVLRALGVSDYGLYSVVCGVVTMFSFVGMSLSSGSQRFIAYSLGVQDEELLKKTFDTIFSIYTIFAIVAIVCLETGGLWFLNHKMNIPSGRMSAANVIFQLSLVSFLAELITIPFISTVIAYERMNFYACLGILKCMLQLLVAIALQYILQEKLIVYGILTCMVSLIINGIYWGYCRSHFRECRKIRFLWNRQTGGELLSYSGWNAVGCVALISRQQGLNVLMNLFFGTLVNAAHSISSQIYGALNQFVNNLYMATRPQITKYYAVGKTGKMWELVFRSSKMAFYILTILAIPLIIEMDTILKLWLGSVPPYTASIARLIILSLLIETQLNQIIAAFQAANKIRNVQLYSSIVLLMNIPLTYCVLKWMGGGRSFSPIRGDRRTKYPVCHGNSVAGENRDIAEHKEVCLVRHGKTMACFHCGFSCSWSSCEAHGTVFPPDSLYGSQFPRFYPCSRLACWLGRNREKTMYTIRTK